jgi:hypothetical protein
MSRRSFARNLVSLTLGIALAGSGVGCAAFGPKVLERSHGRYNEAVRRVDEEQLLRNLVHIRYNETPVHLNVASIAAQYELAGGAEAQPFFEAPNPAGSTFRSFSRVLPGANISGANRPTLTLIPSDNSDAVRQFLTPISADTLVFLTQTSWPVSTVFRLWVERLNGVPNAVTASGPQRDIVPDFGRFRRAAELIQDMQDKGLGVVRAEDNLVEVGGPFPAEAVNASAGVDAVKNGLEYRPRDDGKGWSLIRKERRLVFDVNPAAIGHPDLDELATLLNLQPRKPRYGIIAASGITLDPMQGPPLRPSTAAAFNLRSTAQVYFYLANGVEVPDEHAAAGLVRLPAGPDGLPFDERAITEGLFSVHACRGHKPPAFAFVAVRYRDYWYYIDDRDQASKATFALMLQLSRLDFARHQPGGPLLTLPVGR